MSDPFLESLIDREALIQLVLDDAIVDNSENHLKFFGLAGRPLYRETTDRETILLGPWLVSPTANREEIKRCIAAARAAGKGVFWLGEYAPDALYTHLRHLNAARMPNGAILYFRHYESDVIAAIVPLLDAQQAAHLFGPTRVISLIGGSADGQSVERPEGLPEAGSGPIAFEPWQIAVLDERQQVLSRNKICRFLRREYPVQTSRLDEKELYNKVLNYEESAESINLTSEESVWHWARLNLETNDAVSRPSILTETIKQIPASHVDQTFVSMMPGLIASYRRGKKESIKQ